MVMSTFLCLFAFLLPGVLSDNACLNVTCPNDGLCQEVNGTSSCTCAYACPMLYNPVCGSDNRTYSSSCVLRQENCARGGGLAVAFPGQCPDNLPSCTGITCQKGASCAIVDNMATCVCDAMCSDIYDPQCGSDHVTYSNPCTMERAICQSGGSNLYLLQAGHCDQLPYDPCSDLYCRFSSVCTRDAANQTATCNCKSAEDCADAPAYTVCANNSRTYPNLCEFERAQCEAQDALALVSEGACVGPVTTSPMVPTATFCSDLICASDEICVTTTKTTPISTSTSISMISTITQPVAHCQIDFCSHNPCVTPKPVCSNVYNGFACSAAQAPAVPPVLTPILTPVTTSPPTATSTPPTNPSTPIASDPVTPPTTTSTDPATPPPATDPNTPPPSSDPTAPTTTLPPTTSTTNSTSGECTEFDCGELPPAPRCPGGLLPNRSCTRNAMGACAWVIGCPQVECSSLFCPTQDGCTYINRVVDPDTGCQVECGNLTCGCEESDCGAFPPAPHCPGGQPRRSCIRKSSGCEWVVNCTTPVDCFPLFCPTTSEEGRNCTYVDPVFDPQTNCQTSCGTLKCDVSNQTQTQTCAETDCGPVPVPHCPAGRQLVKNCSRSPDGLCGWLVDCALAETNNTNTSQDCQPADCGPMRPVPNCEFGEIVTNCTRSQSGCEWSIRCVPRIVCSAPYCPLPRPNTGNCRYVGPRVDPRNNCTTSCGQLVCDNNSTNTNQTQVCQESDCGELPPVPFCPNGSVMRNCSRRENACVWIVGCGPRNIECPPASCPLPIPNTANCRFTAPRVDPVTNCTTSCGELICDNNSTVCEESSCGPLPPVPHCPSGSISRNCTRKQNGCEWVTACVSHGSDPEPPRVCAESDCGAPPPMPHCFNGSIERNCSQFGRGCGWTIRCVPLPPAIDPVAPQGCEESDCGASPPVPSCPNGNVERNCTRTDSGCSWVTRCVPRVACSLTYCPLPSPNTRNCRFVNPTVDAVTNCQTDCGTLRCDEIQPQACQDSDCGALPPVPNCPNGDVVRNCSRADTDCVWMVRCVPRVACSAPFCPLPEPNPDNCRFTQPKYDPHTNCQITCGILTCGSDGACLGCSGTCVRSSQGPAYCVPSGVPLASEGQACSLTGAPEPTTNDPTTPLLAYPCASGLICVGATSRVGTCRRPQSSQGGAIPPSSPPRSPSSPPRPPHSPSSSTQGSSPLPPSSTSGSISPSVTFSSPASSNNATTTSNTTSNTTFSESSNATLPYMATWVTLLSVRFDNTSFVSLLNKNLTAAQELIRAALSSALNVAPTRINVQSYRTQANESVIVAIGIGVTEEDAMPMVSTLYSLGSDHNSLFYHDDVMKNATFLAASAHSDVTDINFPQLVNTSTGWSWWAITAVCIGAVAVATFLVLVGVVFYKKRRTGGFWKYQDDDIESPKTQGIVRPDISSPSSAGRRLRQQKPQEEQHDQQQHLTGTVIEVVPDTEVPAPEARLVTDDSDEHRERTTSAGHLSTFTATDVVNSTKLAE